MCIHQKKKRNVAVVRGLFLHDTNTHASLRSVTSALSSVHGVTSSDRLAHDVLVFAEELLLCAEGDRTIYNCGVCSQFGGGFLSMSTSHKNKNRSPSGLYFRADSIIITGYDGICGSDTREEHWAAQAWHGVARYSVSWCLVSFANDLSQVSESLHQRLCFCFSK